MAQTPPEKEGYSLSDVPAEKRAAAAEKGYAAEEKGQLRLKQAEDENLDEAAALGFHQHIEISAEEDRRLLRKIDLRLLPLMCLVFGMQYIDKNALSYASIMGLRTDAHISSGQYSTAAAMFYAGLTAWEIPASRLAQYFPLAKYAGVNATLWGVILACIAAINNFDQLAALRFLLGMAEASVWPSFVLIVSRFYRTEEHAMRTAIWYSMNGFSPILAALVAYKLSKDNMAGSLALAGWRVVFLLWGLVTVALGLLLTLFVPDSPLTAKWLTDDERAKVIARKGQNRAIGNRHFKWEQIREALLDPLVWLYGLVACTQSIPNGGVASFGSIVITSFGFSSTEALLYGTPGNALGAIAILGWLWIAGRYKLRCFIAALSTGIPLLGAILIYALSPRLKWGRLVGYWFCYCNAPSFVISLSLVASNVSGSSKKAFTSGVVVFGYGVGNLIGPYTFTASSAPDYVPAFAVMIAMWAVTIALYLVIWAIYVAENKRRDRLMSSPEYKAVEDEDLLDLSDKRSLAFRYSY